MAKAYMEEIMTLLKEIKATKLTNGYSGPDISMWDAEVPKGSLDIENEKYFWYHHTHGKNHLIYVARVYGVRLLYFIKNRHVQQLKMRPQLNTFRN